MKCHISFLTWLIYILMLVWSFFTLWFRLPLTFTKYCLTFSYSFSLSLAISCFCGSCVCFLSCFLHIPSPKLWCLPFLVYRRIIKSIMPYLMSKIWCYWILKYSANKIPWIYLVLLCNGQVNKYTAYCVGFAEGKSIKWECLERE